MAIDLHRSQSEENTYIENDLKKSGLLKSLTSRNAIA